MGKGNKTGKFELAKRTINHGAAYARGLLKGNRFAGDMSWTQPGQPPVVLCHGFLGTRGTMLPMTKRFQADGRVVFSYHHGTFQMRSLRSSAQGLVDQLERLQTELGVEQFDVVGFSMGGLVSLHAMKFLQASRMVRRLALLGAPVEGTWAGLAGAAVIGAVSQSVWQVLPMSPFLRDLREAPMPEGLVVRQIQGSEDGLCPLAKPLQGVDADHDYVVMPGGHSSLVVTRPFYAKVREFFDREEDYVGQTTSLRRSNLSAEYAAE
ncbi:MAG: alpha/beta hydrolase [Myxococcota bacterium]